MPLSHQKQQELEKIANRRHDGIIFNAIHSLLPRLPQPTPELEDLYQEFVCFAIEAVELWDLRHAYTTILVKHLNIRSLQLFNFSWQKRNVDPGRFVTHFSFFDAKHNQDSWDDDQVFDPTQVRPLEQFEIELSEFKAALSPRSAQLFDYFTDCMLWEEHFGETYISEAFQTEQFARRVNYATEVPKEDVLNFVSEVKAKAPKFMSVSCLE